MKFLLFIILFTFPAIAAPQKNKKFIGYRHKGVTYGEKLPNGAKDLGGGLLSDEAYGVTRFTADNRYMLWLEKIVKRDSRGVPTWVVKDVLSFDNLKNNNQFLFSYSSTCTHNGAENLDLIVLTELNVKKKSHQVLSAWLVNFEKEKFESIAAQGIVCEYISH